MKLTRFLATIIFAAAFVGFSSCEKDDDVENPDSTTTIEAFFPEGYDANAVVAWYTYEYDDDKQKVEAVYLFNNNTVVVTGRKVYTDGRSEKREIIAVCKYKLEGDFTNGTATVDMDGETMIVTIKNGVMSAMDAEYVKQSGSVPMATAATNGNSSGDNNSSNNNEEYATVVMEEPTIVDGVAYFYVTVTNHTKYDYSVGICYLREAYDSETTPTAVPNSGYRKISLSKVSEGVYEGSYNLLTDSRLIVRAYVHIHAAEEVQSYSEIYYLPKYDSSSSNTETDYSNYTFSDPQQVEHTSTSISVKSQVNDTKNWVNAERDFTGAIIGFCYVKGQSAPTIENNYVDCTKYVWDNQGAIFAEITDLEAGTTYSICPFVKFADGTVIYGNWFNTSTLGSATQTDIEAFFPTKCKDKNIAAWYKYSEVNEEKAKVEAVYLFGDETVVVTGRKVYFDGRDENREIVADCTYTITDGDFVNGSASVVLEDGGTMKVTIVNGVMTAMGTQFQKQDGEVPSATDPTE